VRRFEGKAKIPVIPDLEWQIYQNVSNSGIDSGLFPDLSVASSVNDSKKSVMQLKFLVSCGLCILLFAVSPVEARTSPMAASFVPSSRIIGGGDDDKEKKKEKDESTKDAKTRDLSRKPQQHARMSAKMARQSSKFTQKEIVGRAKVRNYFHSTFNTKYGKPVNFRSTSARNQWSKGHKW
jgi:hypothetical protein